MSFIKHWGGGAAYKSGNMVNNMGRGYPCCCTGRRAVTIADKGHQTFSYESEVTCKKCISIMAKRVQPGPIGKYMGIPDMPEIIDDNGLSALVPPNSAISRKPPIAEIDWKPPEQP